MRGIACDRRVLLVLLGCLLLLCLVRATPRLACQGGRAACDDYDVLGRNPGPIPVDAGLYVAILARLRAGEPYYQAWRAELGDTTAVFQTRPPWVLWLMAAGPDWCAWAALAAIGCAACALLAWRGPPWTWGAIALVALGPLALLTDARFALELELWAGMLLFLSAAAYLRAIPWLGVAAGVAGVACREIAAPYLALRAYWAWRDGRRGELAGWAAGVTLLAAGWILHWLSFPVGVGADCRRWLCFGGVAQVLTAMRQTNWLLAHLPATCTGVLLFLVLVGPWCANGGEERRATILGLTFAAVFACVGWWMNFYWGQIAAPLWCLSSACAVSGVVKPAAGLLPHDSAG